MLAANLGDATPISKLDRSIDRVTTRLLDSHFTALRHCRCRSVNICRQLSARFMPCSACTITSTVTQAGGVYIGRARATIMCML